MKYLHSWLAAYIDEGENSLPKGKEFSETISINAFEVEEVEEIEYKLNDKKFIKDFVYEIKTLPNRNHDALSHYFMAKEIATIFNLKFKKLDFESDEYKNIFNIKVIDDKDSENFIKISDNKACSRFMGCKIKNITVKDSPDFIKYRLESIGQKSINNIVDITNYVQFAFNKPMHAYDENKISANKNFFLEARFAKEDETMTTLDNKELKLDNMTLVIADDKKVLGLAGIKGGNNSGIDEKTKSIILESANFNPTLIRKTAQKYNIRTDASKRFENELADQLVEIGIIETIKLIKEYATENDQIEIGEIFDNWPRRKLSEWKYKISVSKNEINNLIGINLNEEEIENIFKRFDFKYNYISTRENLENKIKEVVDKKSKYKNPSSMRTDSPEEFSCSSLISYFYEGMPWLLSISVDKYLVTKDLAQKNNLNLENLKFGDLIFTNSGEGKIYFEGSEYKRGDKVESGIDHVAMYAGDNKIIHISKYSKNSEVEIISLENFLNDKENNIKRKIVGFGRVLENLDEKRFVITVPYERLDLRIKEDIIEEVARVYGLNNIKSLLPELKNKSGEKRIGMPNKRLYCENKIKNILFQNGFSEVYNYSLRNKGDIEIIKSVAQDKNKLRNNLNAGMQESLQKNIFNMPILDINEIRIFEFGNVFNFKEDKEFEERRFCVAIDDGKKNKNYEELKNKILNEIKTELDLKEDIKYIENKNDKQKENCFEIDFDDLIKPIDFDITKENLKYIELNNKVLNNSIKYKNFALTPFIVRDIACFVNADITKENIEKIIFENITELCKSVKCFDEFEKEIEIEENGEKKKILKKSFAFRLIYQDENRTLTDEEVNLQAEKVYTALKNNGFEIR